MKLNQIGSNQTEIELNGATVLFSYKTPVAANKDGKFYRTSQHWSTTTSKHINQWLAGAKAETMPQEWFNNLTA